MSHTCEICGQECFMTWMIVAVLNSQMIVSTFYTTKRPAEMANMISDWMILKMRNFNLKNRKRGVGGCAGDDFENISPPSL